MGRMAEVQRKLLEQLMGAEAMGIVQSDISMWDPKVCRPFVSGICPHDLFTNTKMDLGSCPRTHSVKLKNEYDALMKKAVDDKDEAKVAELNRLKVDYEQTIFGFVDECDRRIRAAQRRLEKTPEENNRTTNLMREIGEIEGAYQAAMAQVEQLGSEGKVEESITQLTKAEALKVEKQDKERELQQLTETSGASGHQKLRVCDICGAYLSVLDSDRRLADHFGGKMHLGYLQLRQLMDEWRARGPLPTGPAPPMPGAGGPPGHGHGHNHGPPPSSMMAAPSGPAYNAPPPMSFRPIPTHNSVPQGPPPPHAAPHGPPAPGFVPASAPAAGGGSGGSSSGRHGSERPRGSDSGRGGGERDHRDRRDDRERDGYRSSRHDDRERDRYDERDRDRGSSSRRYDEREYRSSRREDDDRRSSRREDEERRSSRREDGERVSSRRHDEVEDKRSSSRRSYEDVDADRSADKRRKVEDP